MDICCYLWAKSSCQGLFFIKIDADTVLFDAQHQLSKETLTTNFEIFVWTTENRTTAYCFNSKLIIQEVNDPATAWSIKKSTCQFAAGHGIELLPRLHWTETAESESPKLPPANWRLPGGAWLALNDNLESAKPLCVEQTGGTIVEGSVAIKFLFLNNNVFLTEIFCLTLLFVISTMCVCWQYSIITYSKINED